MEPYLKDVEKKILGQKGNSKSRTSDIIYHASIGFIYSILHGTHKLALQVFQLCVHIA